MHDELKRSIDDLVANHAQMMTPVIIEKIEAESIAADALRQVGRYQRALECALDHLHDTKCGCLSHRFSNCDHPTIAEIRDDLDKILFGDEIAKLP